MPGSLTSSTYVPLPRMKRASSLRLTEWPMPPISTATSFTSVGGGNCLGRGLRLRLAHLPRRVPHGLHDVHVARAAAEVARDGLADLQLGGVGVALEQRDGGHHHAGRAEAA